jgi:hypothetical protein
MAENGSNAEHGGRRSRRSLEIPMRDAFGERRFERGRHLQRQPQSFFHRQRAAQRCGFDILLTR